MAKYFIIGEAGKDELWLVDVQAKSVEQLTDADLQGADFFKDVKEARKNGVSVVKGINIAVATDSRSAADTKMHSNGPDKK
ncbi:MAG TPA: hypothetical protein VK602_18265 [Phyllobacterium sp.]|jgi:hypothetical protein|nr:hypothetical protein [Phyllobacterium sp.]